MIPRTLGITFSSLTTMANTTRDRLRGTLELLVLRTLTWGPRHGYAIARWLEETTSSALRVEDGSLYPALYRMEQRGWIESDWRRSELDRPAKFYRLTTAGKKQLKHETTEWRAFAAAVAIVLEPSQS
jgi:PadR family transcriptional regulator PadR